MQKSLPCKNCNLTYHNLSVEISSSILFIVVINMGKSFCHNLPPELFVVFLPLPKQKVYTQNPKTLLHITITPYTGIHMNTEYLRIRKPPYYDSLSPFTHVKQDLFSPSSSFYVSHLHMDDNESNSRKSFKF